MLNSFSFYALLFLSTFVLTGLIWRYAKKLRLVATPDQRSSHDKDIATGGGVSLAISLFLVLWAGSALNFIPSNLIMILAGGGSLVAIIGLWDDIKPLPIRFRMLVHAMAVFWAIYWLGSLPTLSLGNWQISLGHTGPIITFLFMVWLINLYNFMDGIDGLAGAQSMTVAISSVLIALTHHHAADIWFYTALTAISIGFLCWNFPKAKIFMGDVGSGFLGYLFSVLILYHSQISLSSFWVFTILFGVFLIDTTLTLLRRIVTGEPFYQPHCTHCYQLLAQRWQSHQKVTGLVIAINLLWLLPWAMFADTQPQYSAYIALIALLPILSRCIFIQLRYHFKAINWLTIIQNND